MSQSSLGLGIDAGGTQTRWALARASGEIVANGEVAGMTALQLNTGTGTQHIQQVLAELATAVRKAGQPASVYAGVTGFSEGSEQLRSQLAAATRCIKPMPVSQVLVWA